MSAVGKNLPHDSAHGHVSGESIYIDDIAPLKNEVIVDFYYCPLSHGRIKSLDLSEAAKIDGAVGLWTYKDLGGHNIFGPIIQDEVLLAEDLVEFMGQPIVVVAAENRKAISKMLKAIKCEMEELHPVLTIAEAKKKQQFIGPQFRIKRGDVAAAFERAEHVIEGTWHNLGQDHFYLESQAALVVPGEHKQLLVHSSTQNPSEVQEIVAHCLGLKSSQVVVVTKRMGGGFGGKETQGAQPAAMAALVALKTGRPARIVYNKDQDMQVTGKRHPFENDYKVAFTSDGVITGLMVNFFSDGGATNDLSTAVMAKAVVQVDNAYYLPNVDAIGRVCKTNFPPNTAFRGFGGPQGVAVIENVMEEIAAYLKRDAFEVRRANLYGIDERNTTHYGQFVTNNTLPKIFEQLHASANYAQRHAAVQAHNQKSKTHIRGIAFMPVKFGISFQQGSKNQANALVNIYLDGSIQVSTGATEMGQGVNTHMRQLVAGEFDINPEDVIVMATSTEKNNNTSPTAASSGTDLNGSAAVNACRAIRDRLNELAARYFSALAGNEISPSPSDITYSGGMVFDRRRPELKLSWKEIVRMAYNDRISVGERGFYSTPSLGFNWQSGEEKTGKGTPFLYFTMGAAVAEVVIDRFTGDYVVERVDMLMDIGKPVNPGIARGQITGAFIQGMGWVTTEELKYKDNGELLAHSPTTYKIPNIQDTPATFNVDILDNENPTNIKGSKAVGEPPLLLGLCVFNAIKNALSFESNGEIPRLRLPATNEEVLLRLNYYRQARASEKTGKAKALAK
jgi:xanthine dehydrogenase large subunit